MASAPLVTGLKSEQTDGSPVTAKVTGIFDAPPLASAENGKSP